MSVLKSTATRLKRFDQLSHYLLLAILVFITAKTLTSSPAMANDVNWNKDFSQSLQQAHKSNKYILADVYTSWCGWCKRLDRDTFSNADMIQFLNDKFVCVKLNAEDKGEGAKIASQYHVDGYPCALVFDASGKLKGRISGYRDAAAYKQILSQVMNGQSQGE